MDFGLTEEQNMVVETVRAFVENELYPLSRTRCWRWAFTPRIFRRNSVAAGWTT
jgi:alkylation response protein AidB-like acyl-CoA dehydrogenase